MIGDKAKKKRRGFTLVEALVTMAIFTILMVSFSDIYTQNMRFARQIILRAKLQADARNALEAITRAVRVSDIDYASYPGGTLTARLSSELRLINVKTGDTVRIKLSNFDAHHCYNDSKSSPCIDVCTQDAATCGLATTDYAPLSPRGVKIDSLKFYVTPSADPFNFNQATGAYDSSNQPVVTISAQFHSIAARPSDEWVYSLQTTATPRLYLR